MNPTGLLHAAAARLPAQRAVTQGAQSWTYAQFSERVARTAAYLLSLKGAARGCRIAMALENSPTFLQIMYACWHAGVCAVPMNAKLHPKEFAYILEHSGAIACFAAPSLHPGIAAEIGVQPGLQLIELDADAAERIAQNSPAPLADTQPDDAGWLFYTSGTTGRPKGATITLRNLLFAAQAYYADIDWLDERDCIMHPAPLSHGSGLYALPHIARGSHNVIPTTNSFSPGEVFDLIERYERVSFFAAPTMLVRLMSDGGVDRVRADHLKCIVYGGAPMYVSDLERALGLFGPRLYHLYGQGESPMTITGLSKRAHAQALAANDRALLASAGVARTGVEVRVVDGADRPLPAGEVGEVVTRSDCVMRGYWRNPEADAATLCGGWLHTGDVGSIDERGYLTLKDRSKDLIISGGSNIYPREIEDVLLLDTRVAQASVVGAPHAEWGEEVIAFVVARPGAALTAQALDELCLHHIARYKRPRRYIFVDDLPKNNYGKVLKTALREQAKNPFHRA